MEIWVNDEKVTAMVSEFKVICIIKTDELVETHFSIL